MTTATLPRWTRIVAPVAGLWYAFGLSQSVMAFMADAAAAPWAIWLAYAAACALGLIGAIALAFAPARAAALFGASLAAAVIYFGWLFVFGAPADEDYGVGPVVIAVTLILWAVARRL